MRSRKSFFNSTIFKKNLTHFWPVWLLYSLFLMVRIPIRILLFTINNHAGHIGIQEKKMAVLSDYLTTLFGGIDTDGLTTVAISFMAGVLIAGAVFSYMYKNRSSHMFHSLPVTRTELFFSNYMAGLVMLTAPLMLVVVSTVVVCILCGITALEYLLMWFLVMAGESFFFYSMSVLVGMFTGRLMAMPVFMVILNFLYIGCRYIVTSLMGTISYGLSDSYANRQNSILSPVMYMKNKVSLVRTGNWEEYEVWKFEVCGMKYVAVYAGVAVVFMLFAYLMYRKRNIETAGDLLSVKMIKPVFRWGVAACVAFLSAMVLNNILQVRSPKGEFVEVLTTVCVVGFLTFFAVEMFLRKRFAVFTRKRFVESCVFIGLSALLVIGMEYDFFGLEKKIPEADTIDSILVNMYYPIEEDDAEDMEALMAIHRQIIDSKQEFEQFERIDSTEMKRVEFDYRLKNGDLMVRSYMVPIASSYYKDADSVASKLYAISMEPENYLAGNICLNYDEVRPSSMKLDLINQELEYNSVEIPPAEALKVYHAYIRDMKEGHIYLNPTNNWEDRERFVYVNQLFVEYQNQIVLPTWAEQGYMEETVQYYGTTLELNTKCSHTIAELTILGYLDETEGLMTEEQYDRLGKGLFLEEANPEWVE